MADVLKRLSKDLNYNINQVHTNLQNNRISSLNRRASANSLRSTSSQHSISASLKASPSTPAVAATNAGANPGISAKGLLSALQPAVPVNFQSLLTPMDSQPLPGLPSGIPPLPSLPTQVPLPSLSILRDKEKDPYDRVKGFLKQSKTTYSALKYIFLLPLSWFITFAHAAAKLAKTIILLPLTIFVNIYERQIRATYPQLPSIWLLMNALFPTLNVPSFKDISDIKTDSLQKDLPTLDVNLDAIRNGGDPNAVSSATTNGISDAART